MKYAPKIKILSRISDDDGDRHMEMTADATVSGTENDYVIEYDENIIPDCVTHTVIKVMNGNSVSVVRSGEMSHEITAEKGKRHICHYTMPFGEIVFGVFGRRIDSTVTENGGRLELEYELSYTNGPTTVNSMMIDIYPKGVGTDE